MVVFAVYWVGSRKLIHQNFYFNARRYPIWLQYEVAKLIKEASAWTVKVLFGPAGPQLTPVLRTLNMVLSCIQRFETTPAYEAMLSAWTRIRKAKKDQVFDIYVTTHSVADLGIDKLIEYYTDGYASWMEAYMRAPLRPELKSHPKVVLAALQLGLHFNAAPPDLRKNKRFVLQLAAVFGNTGRLALEFAHRDLRCDKDLVVAVVALNPMNLQLAAPNVQRDKSFVLAAVQKNESCLSFAPEFQTDRDVVLAAVASFGVAIVHAPFFLDDKEVVLKAVQHRGLLLRHVGPSMTVDKDVVLAAVAQNALALRYAPAFHNDKDVVLTALKGCSPDKLDCVLKLVPPALLDSDCDVAAAYATCFSKATRVI